MPHEDIVFADATGPKNFTENLPLYLRVDIIENATLDARRNLEALFLTPAALNDFFIAFNPNIKPFQDWDHFLKESGDELVILNGFVASYREMLGMGESGNATGDWTLLNLDEAAIIEQFKNSFSHFLETYLYDPNVTKEIEGVTLQQFEADIEEFKDSLNSIGMLAGVSRTSLFQSLDNILGGGGEVSEQDALDLEDSLDDFLDSVDSALGFLSPPHGPFKSSLNDLISNAGMIIEPGGTEATDSFFERWGNFMAVTAAVEPQGGPVSTASLGAYRNIYESFGFDPSGFENRFLQFYEKTVTENGLDVISQGWFIPSHSFDEWFEAMREEYIQVQFVSSVGSSDTNRTLVIDRILRLLILLIDVLQRITAAQADRLTFLTAWQSAYTELLTEIPRFTRGDGGPIAAKNEDWARSTLNPSFEQVTQTVQARRNVVQDEAKQLQTTLNSSQDAANQQTQIATALLQQLSTILSQIFR